MYILARGLCVQILFFLSEIVYGATNGRPVAPQQIQKGLTGLHLISRTLKVRLKQICGE